MTRQLAGIAEGRFRGRGYREPSSTFADNECTVPYTDTNADIVTNNLDRDEKRVRTKESGDILGGLRGPSNL